MEKIDFQDMTNYTFKLFLDNLFEAYCHLKKIILLCDAIRKKDKNIDDFLIEIENSSIYKYDDVLNKFYYLFEFSSSINIYLVLSEDLHELMYLSVPYLKQFDISKDIYLKFKLQDIVNYINKYYLCILQERIKFIDEQLKDRN